MNKNTGNKIETMIAGVESFEQLKEMLVGMLQTLTPIESRVIMRRFGIVDGNPMSLEAISREIGCSPGHILQIETDALEKIRNLA